MPNVNPPLKPVAPVSNTAPHPAATSLAGFIDAAHAQGFGNLDPNVLTAVASGGTNTPMTLPVLNNIKNAAASGWSSVGHFFADPNLSSPKTVAEKIAHHFINTGLPSAASEDIKSTQQILAYRGYAANLPIDGTWNGDWNNALNTMKQDEFKKTSAGNTGARNLFTELFTPMMWSHAIPLATSIVKNVGNVFADAGQNVSDFAKMTTGTLSPEDKARIDSYGAFHYTSQAVDALSTYYLASSAVTGLSKTAFATKDAIAAGKTAGAKTSAGALAKVLPKESVQRPTTIMNSILPEIEGGARRLPFTKSLQNMPVTNYMNDLATGVHESWQANRNLLATPYRLPIVKALGTAGSELGKLGFKAGAVGTGENFVGDKNGLQAQTLDNLTPIAGRVGNILDLLQVAMHPDLSAEGASLKAGVGAQVEASRKAMADGLDQTQALANFERGTTLDSSKIIDALAKRGNVPNPKDIFDVHVANEINKLSAYHAGEGVWQNMVNKGLQDATDMDARQNVITSESHRIMSDPAALTEARNSYLLKPGVLAKDLAKNRTNILTNYQKGQGGDIIDKLENDHWFRENFVPHADQLYDQVAQSLDYPEALKGKIGWANKDTVLAGDAQAQAVQFLNELEKARPGYVRPETMEPAKLDMMGQPVYENLTNAELPKSWDRANASPAEVKLHDQMVNYLGIEMSRDVRGLRYVSPENLALLIMKRSHYLAGELHLPSGASPELEQAFNVARTRGMRPVVGTDIGFQHHLDPKTLGWVGADQSKIAHAADKLGLDFQQIDPATRGQHTYAEMLNSVQTAMLDEKKFPSGSLPVWGQANHLVTFLHDVIPTDLNWIGKTSFNVSANKAVGRVLHPVSGSSWNDEIAKIQETSDKAITRTEAKSELQKQLSTEGGPQFWTRKQVIEALTNKGDEQGMMKNAKGNLVEAPAMPLNAASNFYYAMQKGLRDAPAYVTGFNPFNKMLDSTFGLTGIPIAINGKRVLDLTGGIRKTLLNARYLGSYRFAYLRSVKAALKGTTADVPFTLDPAGELSRLSEADQQLAKEIHAKLFTPNEERNAVTDYLNQETARRDMFNVYNPLATETRNSLYLYRNALKDSKNIVQPKTVSLPEIKQTLGELAKETKPAYKDGSPLFHGASSNMEKNELDKDVYREAHGNLYGDGFYTTDRIETAQSYTKKGRGSEPTLHSVVWNGKGTPKILNLDAPANDDLKSIFSSLNDEDYYDFSNLEELLAQKNVTGAELYKSLRADLNEKGSPDLAAEVFQDITTQMVDKGYDAIQHKGGTFRTSDGPEHNVTIWLKPSDLSVKKIEPKLIQEASIKTVSTPKPELTAEAWTQLKKTSDNIINYGNQTAAEKSVNAFFFPFSFEKTVMRQLGGHLLDHAGTRLVVAAAVNAYNSDPQKVKDWMETNLPLFKELEKFNPFYHGIGVGQFGGINRLPYDVTKQLFVSMVVPQPVTNMNAAKAAVALIPSYRDLANILIGNDPNGKKDTYWGGELLSTAKELKWIIANAIHNQNPDHAPFVSQDHLPPAAQISKAWDLRSQLLTGLTKALDVNRHGGDIKWPDNLPGGIAGQKINTASIGALINHIYPAWDNAKLAESAAVKNAEVFRERAIIQKNNPQWAIIFNGFIKASDSVQGQISKDSIDTAKLAQDTATLRTIAIALSKKEPSFYNFYRKNYQTKYGPLEMMK